MVTVWFPFIAATGLGMALIQGAAEDAAALMVSASVTLAVAWFESVTVKLGLYDPCEPDAGVPPSAPVLRLMVKPFGRPVAVQVYPPAPPLAVNCTGPYPVPTVPRESDAGAVIVRPLPAALIVRASVALAVALLKSCTVKRGL